MPSEAAGQRAASPVDVALGDRFGRSCGAAFMNVAAEVLSARGLHVAHNQPYAGGFITEHYGRPLEGWHALQVEFRRQLFMDESSGKAHEGTAQLQALLMELTVGDRRDRQRHGRQPGRLTSGCLSPAGVASMRRHP